MAWIDEVLGLDPAIQFINGNGYTSMLWPQRGSDHLFLAYLPLQGMTHVMQQWILPFDIYWVRFPSAIYLITGTILLYCSIRTKGLSVFIALALITLIINEKSLFETTRGVRIEPLIFCILSATFYSILKHRIHLTAILITLLLFSHPNVWPICLVLFLNSCFRYNNASYFSISILKPNVLWLYPIGGLLLFSFLIDFQFGMQIQQFSHQGSEHSAHGGILTRLSNHFITRFWPYYWSQPWVPLLIYVALGQSIYAVFKKKFAYLQTTIILTHLIWLIFLGPFYRYNSILVLLSVLWLVDFIIAHKFTLHQPKWKIAVFTLVFLSSTDVILRHSMAIIQREERNPYPVLDWLESNLPQNEEYIITGSDIAYYATAQKQNAAYFMYNMPPYTYDFKKFQKHYIISPEPIKNTLLVAQYRVPSTSLSKKFNSKTYCNLYLNLVSSPNEYEKILIEMDDESRIEVSKR